MCSVDVNTLNPSCTSWTHSHTYGSSYYTVCSYVLPSMGYINAYNVYNYSLSLYSNFKYCIINASHVYNYSDQYGYGAPSYWICRREAYNYCWYSDKNNVWNREHVNNLIKD